MIRATPGNHSTMDTILSENSKKWERRLQPAEGGEFCRVNAAFLAHESRWDYWIATLSNVAVLLSALLWAVTARPTLALALIVTLVVASCVQVAPSAE
jgi:hypothetical protein